MKLVLIEVFEDVFVISYNDRENFVGSIKNILLYKLFIKYLVILIELYDDYYKS